MSESTQVAPEAPTDAAAAETPEEPPVTPRRRIPGGEERTHRGKFRAIYAILGVVLAAGLAGLVVLLFRADDPSADLGWSAWRPTTETPEEMTQEIAAYVGRAYRLDGDSQLVNVLAATPLRVQDVPVVFVAIQSAPAGAPPVGDEIPFFEGESTVSYSLCGFGQECAIDEGTPSQERLRLLRREALELALYTFRYVEGTDHVVAFMPPRPGTAPTYALFFQRSELEQHLDEPLRTTLPSVDPPLADQIPPSETVTIDELTLPRFFAFRFQQLQDGRVVLVLEDPAQAPAPESTTTEGDETGTGQTQTTTQPADEAAP